MSTDTLRHRDYLGDGVYVGTDGHHIVLWLDNEGAFGPNAVALGPGVIRALEWYVTRNRRCKGR